MGIHNRADPESEPRGGPLHCIGAHPPLPRSAGRGLSGRERPLTHEYMALPQFCKGPFLEDGFCSRRRVLPDGESTVPVCLKSRPANKGPAPPGNPPRELVLIP